MGTTTDVSRLDVFAGRVYGLDALRALAVVLVITYHLFPLALPGGFIGVDVFFVVSGFLITGLLLRQWRTTGSIDLLHFWQRRARRLIPALVAVVLLTGAAAALVGGDILVGIGRQIVGALTFTSNWIFIASGSSYGSDFYPEPFTHLWSLAVEEQFYLMWPLVVVVVLAWGGGRRQGRGQGRRRLTPLRLLGAVALAVGAVSAVMMALIAANAADPSRAYYGTDTHVVGLMLGAALAAAVSGYRGRRLLARIRHDRRAKWAVAMVAVAALAVIGAIAAMSAWSQQWTYRGGITVASLATMFVIFALLCLPGRSRRAERGALAWVGERSYGLYLYHWPLVVVMFYAFANVPQWLSGLIVLSGTLMLAALSYRYVEQPIRRLGFRATFRGAIRAMQPLPGVAMRTRAAVSALGLAAAVTVAGTVYGVAVAPSSTQLDQQLAAGSALLNSTDELGLIEDLDETDDVLGIGADLSEAAADSANADGTSRDAVNDDSASGAAIGGDNSDSGSGAATDLDPKIAGKNTTIIGDSVTIAAAESLQEQLPGVVISAAVGRNMLQAPDIVKKIATRGKLRDYVVIALATNSTLTEDQLRKVVRAVGKDRAVILVNGYADRSWIKSTNKTIAQAPKLFGNVVVADWAAVAKKNPKIFGADGVHPKPDRTGAYADVIVAAIEEAQQSVFETTE